MKWVSNVIAFPISRYLSILLILVFYFIFRAQEQTGDSLNYALAVKTGYHLFHPHHLLYSPLVRILHWLINAVTPIDAIVAAQIHNLIWAAACLWYVSKLIIWYTQSRLLAVLGVCFLAVCCGFWGYSTLAEVYVPAAGATMALTWIITKMEKSYTRRDIYLAALLYALTTMYHQSCILLGVPLLLFLFQLDRAKFTKNVVRLCGFAAAIVLGFYIVGYIDWKGDWSLSGFVDYCLLYKSGPHTNWGTLANVTPTGCALLLKSFVRNIVDLPPGSTPSVLLAIGSFLFLCLTIAYAVGRRFHAYSKERLTIVFWGVWMVVHFAFVLWWIPGENEFLIVLLPPFVVLFILTIHTFLEFFSVSSMSNLVVTSMALAVVALGVLNLKSSILPRHSSLGRGYIAAQSLDECVDNDCTILTTWTIQQNLMYYFDRNNVVEVSVPILLSESGKRIPEEYNITSDSCVVLLNEDLPVVINMQYLDSAGLETEGDILVDWLLRDEQGNWRQITEVQCSRSLDLLQLTRQHLSNE